MRTRHSIHLAAALPPHIMEGVFCCGKVFCVCMCNSDTKQDMKIHPKPTLWYHEKHKVNVS